MPQAGITQRNKTLAMAPSSAAPQPALNAQQLKQWFVEKFNHQGEVCVASAPGRINLLGDHTDYNGGLVLPITLDRAVWVAMAKRDDDQVRLYSNNFDDLVGFTLGQPLGFAADSWQACVAGVIEQMTIAGYLNGGIDVFIAGDVPLGAGLSSSAAAEIATAMGLEQLGGHNIDALWMIKMCQQVEHDYVNVKCGIMDQFVSRLGQHDHTLFLDCNDLSFEPIPINFGEIAIVYAHSGAPRQLANSAYNERFLDCQKALSHFKRLDQSIHSLAAVSLDQLSAARGQLSDQVLRRCLHVVSENERVLAASKYFKAADFSGVGQLMNQSHASLRDHYESSLVQVDRLVAYAQRLPAVYGARITGAGFGGCMVALAKIDSAQQTKTQLMTYLHDSAVADPMVGILTTNFQASAQWG